MKKYLVNLHLVGFTVRAESIAEPKHYMEELIVVNQGDRTLSEVRRMVVRDLHAAGWRAVTMKVEPERNVLVDPTSYYWSINDMDYSVTGGN